MSPGDQARFVILDSTPPGFPQSEFLQRIIQAVPHEVIQGSNSNLAEIMAALSDDLKRRSGAEGEADSAASIVASDRPAKGRR